jgi:hypothetical protein
MNRPIAPHPVNPARPRPLPSPRPNPPTPPRPQPRPGRLVSTLYLVGACLGAGLLGGLMAAFFGGAWTA